MKIRKSLLVIITIFTLNSCFVYNSQFTPPVLIESKNDVQINAGYWYNGVMPGGYGSLTYGVNNNLFLQGYTIFEGNNVPLYYEASAAWYKPVSKKFSMGIHAGYLYENVKASSFFNIIEPQYKFTGSNRSPFITLQSVFKWENTILCIGNKIGYYQSNILKETTENYQFQETEAKSPERIRNNALLIEPVLYLMPRNEGINMTISFSYSRPFFIPLNSPEGYKKYDEAFNPAGNFAIGLIYHFNFNDLLENIKN